MRVFITGVTGFVGSAIAGALAARGDTVLGLTRRARPPTPSPETRGLTMVSGDPCAPGAWQELIAGCDAVVHLAGESIGGRRLSDEHKRLVRATRLDSTRQVVAAHPKVLVCANGVDYYPFDDGERAYDEAAPAGDTFLARLCADWQAAAQAASSARVVLMRTAVVLGRGGEALGKMVLPFKLFLGGRIGSGRQWFSWVHIEDVVGAYLHALDHAEVTGPVNLVSPEAVRQGEFARALGRALHRPARVPVPAFAIRAAVGELAEYVLGGRRVVPSALARTGFTFRLPDLTGALAASL